MTDGLAMLVAAAGGVASGLYGARWTAAGVSLARTVTKTAATLALALAAWLAGGPVLLVAALGFSALGDGLLAGPGERRFQAGVVAFAIAHGLYVPLFIWLGAGSVAPPLWHLVVITLLAVAAAGLLFGVLWGKLGALRWPLTGYFAIILAMGIAAWCLPPSPAALVIAAGATAFMISDMVLGFDMFALAPEDPRRRITGPVVWFSYWGGQAAIAAGVLMMVSGTA